MSLTQFIDVREIIFNDDEGPPSLAGEEPPAAEGLDPEAPEPESPQPESPEPESPEPVSPEPGPPSPSTPGPAPLFSGAPVSGPQKARLPEPRPLEPVAAGERYELIDVLRGFALSGVLLANLMSNILRSASRQSLAELPAPAFEMAVLRSYRFLVSGKFLFLFALLFGLGLAIQMERARARGVDVAPTYLRRLGILFVLGLAHAFLLWSGDILHIYALAGLALLALRSRSDRLLVAGGTFLLTVSAWVIRCWPAVLAWIGVQFPPAGAPSRSARIAERISTLSQGGYTEVVLDNLAFLTRPMNPFLTLDHCVYSLGIFLLGFVLGRRRILQEAARHRLFFRRLLFWGLGLGLPLSLATAFARDVGQDSPWYFLIRLPIPFGTAALAGAYLAAVALLYQHHRGYHLLRPLAPVGRMALTHYLTHSVAYVLIFSGVGFGLVGKLGPSAVLPLTLLILGTQIAVSPLWLRRFRFGPAEWVWRSLTYGRRPSFAARVPAVEA